MGLVEEVTILCATSRGFSSTPDTYRNFASSPSYGASSTYEDFATTAKHLATESSGGWEL
jgi:hypothetical protein